MLIKEMPHSERPRERLKHQGKAALSTSELIAIILRTGTAGRNVLQVASDVYQTFRSIGAINATPIGELAKINGLGETKAIQLIAALELGRRMYEEHIPEYVLMDNPKAVFQYMRPHVEHLKQEVFYALYLNTKSQIIHMEKLFVGGLNVAVVHPREVFKYALNHSAASVIMVHNHPSGDPAPSKSDLDLTRSIVKGGAFMSIDVLDHIIIGHGRFYSLREHGQIE